MPTQYDIRKFYHDPQCRECGRSIRGWGRAKCDNCGGSVCRRHRPLFQSYWQCGACRQQQQTFTTPTQDSLSTINQNQPTSTIAVSTLLARLAQAQELFDLGFDSEAEAIVNAISEEVS